ncbi:hypothetical protein LAZ67_6001432 [Cordylochernes scorpioides]|uniref:L-serine deaminase n=1 Tax=Cordylochernes scorpioides TaxID=51811 RepID=A0ABY6KP30_9ARAC|nr:hypothetical protein LAZ67_6001432 [Cordylochernes scorpioides]
MFVSVSVMLTPEEVDGRLGAMKEGLELALHRTKAWAKYAKDVLAYVERRLHLGMSPATFCDKFPSIFCAAIDQDLENSNNRLAICALLQGHKFVEPMNFQKNEVEKIRKHIKEAWHKELKKCDEAVASLHRARTSYAARQQDYSRAREASLRLESSGDLPKVDRRRRSEDEAFQKALEAETTYKACVAEANDRQLSRERVKEQYLQKIREMITQADEVMKTASVGYFDLVYRSVAPLPIQTLADSARLYEPGTQFMEFVKRLPNNIQQDARPNFAFEPHTPNRRWSICSEEGLSSLPSVGRKSSLRSDLSCASKAASTHTFKELENSSRCRECDALIYRRGGLECEVCGLASHKKCLEVLAFKCPQRKLAPPKPGVFGVDLATQAWESGEPVPAIVKICVHDVESRGLTTQGLYRTSGAKLQVDRLCQLLEQGPEWVDLSAFPPIVVASALKVFYRKLPEPILTMRLYQEFVKLAKDYPTLQEGPETNQVIKKLRHIVCKLPPVHLDNLAFLIHHLFRVSQHSSENNMPASNLGIVFGPTLMRPSADDGPTGAFSTISDSFLQSRVVEFLVAHCREVFDGNLEAKGSGSLRRKLSRKAMSKSWSLPGLTRTSMTDLSGTSSPSRPHRSPRPPRDFSDSDSVASSKTNGPLIREAFTIIGRPPDLQGWVFGHGLDDDALAILASAKTRIYSSEVDDQQHTAELIAAVSTLNPPSLVPMDGPDMCDTICTMGPLLQFQDICSAAFRINDGILKSPCEKSILSEIVGCDLYLKKDFLQITGSFKERAARHLLMMLNDQQRVSGVMTASSGNFALGLSYQGQQIGIPVTIVMPMSSPLMKIQLSKNYGAEVIIWGTSLKQAKDYALKISKEKGTYYVDATDHPLSIAGAGTMGLEIVEQIPDVDAVVVPVGSGGLIAGLALAVKTLKPSVKIIGVESETCPNFSLALEAGRPVTVHPESSLADGLCVSQVGFNAFNICAPLVDKVVVTREEFIALAVLRMAEKEKAVVEGSGACGLAALLAGELPELADKRVVVAVTGGNIDTTAVGRCLERGLAVDGRLIKVGVTVGDRPGGVSELVQLISKMGIRMFQDFVLAKGLNEGFKNFLEDSNEAIDIDFGVHVLTSVSLNLEYNNKKLKVNLNVPLRTEVKNDHESTWRQINQERRYYIEAAIVRIMKMRKLLSHQQLVLEVINHIKDIYQERNWIKSDIFSAKVKVVCETRDRDHALHFEKELRNRYSQVSLLYNFEPELVPVDI